MTARKPQMVVVDGVRYRAEDAPRPTKTVPVVAVVETEADGAVPTAPLSTTGTIPSTATEPTETESAGTVPADGEVIETGKEVTDVDAEKRAEEIEDKKEPVKKAAPSVRNKARQPADAGGAGASRGVETK